MRWLTDKIKIYWECYKTLWSRGADPHAWFLNHFFLMISIGIVGLPTGILVNFLDFYLLELFIIPIAFVLMIFVWFYLMAKAVMKGWY